MNASLILCQKNKALPKPPPSPKSGAIRRIFDNSQLIERFDKWLLICGKAANTRRNYTSDARQSGKFLVDKPLTSVTKQDVRAFIAEMYAKGRKPQTMQRKLNALRVLFDCLQLGGQVRVSVARLVSAAETAAMGMTDGLPAMRLCARGKRTYAQMGAALRVPSMLPRL